MNENYYLLRLFADDLISYIVRSFLGGLPLVSLLGGTLANRLLTLIVYRTHHVHQR